MINLLNINTIERYNDFHNFCQCMYNETIKTNNMDSMLDDLISYFGENYDTLIRLSKMEDFIMNVVNKEMFNKIIDIINPENNSDKKQDIYNIIVNNETMSIINEGYICVCRLMLYKIYIN